MWMKIFSPPSGIGITSAHTITKRESNLSMNDAIQKRGLGRKFARVLTPEPKSEISPSTSHANSHEAPDGFHPNWRIKGIKSLNHSLIFSTKMWNRSQICAGRPGSDGDQNKFFCIYFSGTSLYIFKAKKKKNTQLTTRSNHHVDIVPNEPQNCRDKQCFDVFDWWFDCWSAVPHNCGNSSTILAKTSPFWQLPRTLQRIVYITIRPWILFALAKTKPDVLLKDSNPSFSTSILARKKFSLTW